MNYKRIVLNTIFYVFYVLLASIAFSFVFPTILVILWQEIWLNTDPRFANIQIAIVVLVLVFSLIFRKYCFLPVKNSSYKQKKPNLTSPWGEEQEENKKIKKEKTRKLDIKIGKEIKK